MNQFQMFLLVPFIGAYISDEVLAFLEGMKFAMFSFSFLSIKDISFLNFFKINFSFPQDDEYMEAIGLESKSSLLNHLSLFYVIG